MEWTESEIQQLRAQYGKLPVRLMDINGRGRHSIEWKARELGLRSNRNKMRTCAWTERQEQFLRENYGKMSASEIASALSRDRKSVFAHAYKLRLTLPLKGRSVKNPPVTADMIARYESGETVHHLAKELCVCEEVMVRILSRAGAKLRSPKEVSNRNLVHALRTVRLLSASGVWGKIVSASHQGIPLSEWRTYCYSDQRRINNSTPWKQWRGAVFRRDEYRCVMCGDRSRSGNRVTIDPHHILPKSTHAALIFDVNNGVTLCRACHRSIARRELLYARQFQEYVAALHRNSDHKEIKQSPQLRLAI